MNERQLKGKEIAENKRISQTPRGWIIPSQNGNGSYLVYKEGKQAK